MKTDLVVSGYIIHNNKVLLIHHRKLDMWLPPGGHIEENETPDQTMKREIREETNLNVEILNQSEIPVAGHTKENLATPFHVNRHSVGDHDHCCFFYICRPLNPEDLRINKELKDFAWFSEEDLKKEYVPDDVRHIASKAFRIYDLLSE